MHIKVSKTSLNKSIKLFAIAFLIVTAVLLVVSIISRPKVSKIPPVNCIPTFADGDGPYYLSNAPVRSKLYSDTTTADKITIDGVLWNTNCTKPVANATLDIWQADETGTYVNEWNRGKIITNENGEFHFETIMPKGYGEGTGYRPPHIHYKAFVNNQLIITSEIFFEDTRDKQGFNNAYIVTLEKQGDVSYGYYNIVLPDYN